MTKPPEYEVGEWYEEESQEPEPEQNVDLIIDHVDRKDAEAVKPATLRY